MTRWTVTMALVGLLAGCEPTDEEVWDDDQVEASTEKVYMLTEENMQICRDYYQCQDICENRFRDGAIGIRELGTCWSACDSTYTFASQNPDHCEAWWATDG